MISGISSKIKSVSMGHEADSVISSYEEEVRYDEDNRFQSHSVYLMKTAVDVVVVVDVVVAGGVGSAEMLEILTNRHF